MVAFSIVALITGGIASGIFCSNHQRGKLYSSGVVFGIMDPTTTTTPPMHTTTAAADTTTTKTSPKNGTPLS